MFGVMPYLEIAFGGVSAAGNLVDSLMGLIVIVFLVILCRVFYGGRKKYVLPEPTEGVQCEACDIPSCCRYENFEKKTILIGGILSAISIIISLGFMIGTPCKIVGRCSMIMILKIVISAVAYLILAPFAGGLLTGMGRRFSSGLQAKRVHR